MAEDTTPPTGTPATGEKFEPITSQEDLNRIIGDRVARERAKYADYTDLKAKADKADKVERDSKSEIEKLSDDVAKLSEALGTERMTALRARIQARHQISDEDAALFLTGTDEATLAKQAEALASKTTGKPSSGNRAPREGTTPPPPAEDEARKTVRQLFGGGRP